MGMFLRRNRRLKNGDVHEYWTLVESVRTERGPRQHIVATLGKLPSLDDVEHAGWEEIARLLDGRKRTDTTPSLFGEKPKEPPQWAQVDIRGVRVERVREFGKVYLGLALWRRLKLHEFFASHIEVGKEQVDWATVACILALGQLCAQRTELALSEQWYATTALDDLLGVNSALVYDNRLYRALDQVEPLRETLFSFLRNRYETLFGKRFEFLLYDITSTYMEGQAERNPMARHGYSRDKRSDCKQVCIGLVVTPEGLPLAYEVFDGNRADVTTVEDIVDLMERKYGRAQRIWAMDRGMVSEENLDYMRQRNALYIVGTPKGRLRKFERQLHDTSNWHEVEKGIAVKLIDHPDSNGQERYIICRSISRHEKEAAMLRRQKERLLDQLHKIDAGLKKRPQKLEHTGWRIGKWMGRNTIAAKILQIEIIEDAGMAIGLKIAVDENKEAWAAAAQGTYLLRTNCIEQDPAKLWQWYMQLTEVEDAFRISKSDLGLHPVYHQREDRVRAHIMICFLALVMWRYLEMWLDGRKMGCCARQVLDQMATIHSMDVILPIKDKAELRLRVVSKPEKLTADLLSHLGLSLPNKPKIIENVVETFRVLKS